jgi:hypothetical protein
MQNLSDSSVRSPTQQLKETTHHMEEEPSVAEEIDRNGTTASVDQYIGAEQMVV